MKTLILLFITLFLACSTSQPNLPWENEYYIEIINRSDNIFIKEIIQRIDKSVVNKSYVLNKDEEIVLEERNKERLDHNYNKPHHFYRMQEDYTPKLGDVKVKVYLNKLNQAGEVNVDFRYSYYKRHKKSYIWEGLLNPGNFRFDKGKETSEIADSIASFIVRLTFK